MINFAFASDDVFWMSWKYGAEEDVPSLRHTNEVMGGYVTAGARINLYRYLDGLHENAMYCDTDSVIYIQPRDGHPLIETRDKLWDMTSELRHSQMISDFACGGPKNYAYRVVDTVNEASQTVRKIRDNTLNYNASKSVNVNNIRDMILKGNKGYEPSDVNVHTDKKIKRKGAGGEQYLLLQNLRIKYIANHFSRVGD